MALNLTSRPELSLKDTYVLQLLDPNTEELLFDDEGDAVTITLYGPSSKQYRNAMTAMQNRELKRKAKKEVIKAEEFETESVGILVACSATSTLELDGSLVDNKEAFKSLYSNSSYAWIRTQVDAALGTQSNFLGQ